VLFPVTNSTKLSIAKRGTEPIRGMRKITKNSARKGIAWWQPVVVAVFINTIIPLLYLEMIFNNSVLTSDLTFLFLGGMTWSSVSD